MKIFQGITIDSAYSRDLDDAIWVEHQEEGWIVTVSIADVASAVTIGSPEDLAAQAIGATRYAAYKTVQPMLPPRLSEQALSLLPGRTRSVLAIVIHLDHDLTPLKVELSEGQLSHRGRLSHDDAGKRIGQDDLEGKMLTEAWALAAQLLDKRRTAGALAYFSTRSGVITDEEGRLVSLSQDSKANRAHVIVQELMILANYSVCRQMVEQGIPLLYRNHRANPLADRNTLRDDLALASDGGVQAASAQSRLSMMLGRASLGAKATGHFGLNLPVYAWFTSPIRRYADLVNQRTIMAVIRGETPPYTPDALDALAQTLTTLADKQAQERADAFKRFAENLHLRRLRQGRLSSLTDADFRGAVKAAVEHTECPPELTAEIQRRLSSDSLLPKEIGRLINAHDPTFDATKKQILYYLAQAPNRADKIVEHLIQAHGLAPATWDRHSIGDVEGPSFSASITIAFNGHDTSSGTLCGTSSEEADSRACVSLLTSLSGVDWQIPASWTAPQPKNQAPSTAQPSTSARPAMPLRPNAKGELIAMCQRMSLPLPDFDLTMSGPDHARVFTATLAVTRPRGETVHGKGVAGTRKDAERLAATEALIQMETTQQISPSGQPPQAQPTSNPKGALQELCVARKLPLPVYTVTGTGPAHAPTFRAEVAIHLKGSSPQRVQADGRSRKEAEGAAAMKMLEALRAAQAD